MIRDALRPILGPSSKDMQRFFALAHEGKDSQLEGLLAAGDFEVDAWGPAGQHALYKAVLSKSQATLRVLLKHKANPNRLTEPGYAAIHEAAHSGQPDMIRDLHAAGADLNLKSASGGYAIAYACAKGHIDAALVLASLGASFAGVHSQAGETVLHQAAGCSADKEGSDTLAKLALEAGVSVNAFSERGFTPLLKAIEAKNAPMVVLLLEADADPLLPGQEPKDRDGTRWHVGKTPEEFAISIRAESCEAVLRSWSAKRAAQSILDEIEPPLQGRTSKP